MTTNLISSIDSQKHHLDGVVLPQGTTLTGSPSIPPVVGGLAYQVSNGDVYVSDGSTWYPVGGSSSAITVGAPIAATDNNALVIAGNVLKAEYADHTHNGILSTTSQSIAGFKTFDGCSAPQNSGANNVNFGDTFTALTSGTKNTAVGVGTSKLITTATDTVAIGFNALANNTTSDTVAIGSGALQNNTSGIQNIAVGFDALLHNITGNNNTALGQGACIFNTSGSSNTGVGNFALQANNTSSQNTAVGDSALFGATAGSNTAVGYNCLLSLITGTGNVALGSQSGIAYTGAEANNLLLANPGTLGESNAIYVGNGTHATATIGGTYGVTVAGSTAVVIGPTGQLGTVVSSIKYKKNITEINQDLNKEILNKINCYRFNYKVHSDEEPKEYGCLAEEMNEICPDLVLKNKEGKPDGVKYHFLPIMLLAENKRLNRVIDDLSKDMYKLQKKIKDIEASLKDKSHCNLQC